SALNSVDLPTLGRPTIPHLNPISSSTISVRHGRACAGMTAELVREVSPASRHLPCQKFPWPAAPDAPCSGTKTRVLPPASLHSPPPPRTRLPPRRGRSWRNPRARGCAPVP